MRIAIIITGLSTGGAESMLLRLLERIDRSRFDIHVFSLMTSGEIGPRINALGIPVEALGMKRNHLNLGRMLHLAKRLRDLDIDLVHTWMYHADLLGGLAARIAGIKKVIWGIHHSTHDRATTRLSTRIVVWINALLSNWLPMGILSCSKKGQDVHASCGYNAKKIAVIPNGFDLERFRPDLAARFEVRNELCLPNNTPLVGIIGRYDPMKNHIGFIQKAGILHSTQPQTHFLLIGKGLDETNAILVTAAKQAGVANNIHLLGRRDDIPRLMASLDVLASSSLYGEAFPMVLGEAMACGIPCVATDVGDSAIIVDSTGRIVQPGDSTALAVALNEVLTMNNAERSEIGVRARKRVAQKFDIHDVTKSYEDYYLKIHKENMPKVNT